MEEFLAKSGHHRRSQGVVLPPMLRDTTFGPDRHVEGARATHWQCNTEVQDLQDKPWKNEGLNSLEEGMPRLKENESEKAARTEM